MRLLIFAFFMLVWIPCFAAPMSVLQVQGSNGDVDTGSEDLWSQGGEYWFPSAAAATTIVSSDTNDDGDPAGTGARTVRVYGLDTNGKEITEDVTMNGTNAVTLSNEFLAVNLVEVLTAGSTKNNVGVISVKHGSVVIQEIGAVEGRSSVAVYSAGAIARVTKIKRVYGGITDATNGVGIFRLLTRKSGGAWQLRKSFAVHGTSKPWDDVPVDIALAPGEQVKLRCESTADNALFSGGFEVQSGHQVP